MMGRKRVFKSNADKQAVYRIRKKERDAKAIMLAEEIASLVKAARVERVPGAVWLDIESLEDLVVRLVGSLTPTRLD
jgi:3-mercaptopyruvate sulfurtransferase SseA